MLGFAIVLFIIVLNLIAHEMAHAVAMSHYGIEIDKAGIGIPIPGLTFKWKPKFLRFPLTISPLVLFAYVKTTEAGNEKLKKLPYKDRAVIYSSGALTNMVIALLLLPAFLIFVMRLDFTFNSVILFTIIASVVSAIFFIAGLFNRRIRYFICSCAAPVIGVAMFGLLLYLILPPFVQNFHYAITHAGASEGGSTSVAGPAQILKIATNLKHTTSAFILGFLVSSGLALTNLLPIYPLDGGQTSLAFLERYDKKLISALKAIQIILFLVLMFLVIGSEILAFK
ncbi:MAG: hypothetical protein A3H51_00240 [Candidatus Spechtbacteria bacterium RIFCSPLOWO2_02_FULL_38_8]|uniref:Peptidase M50 domain-containing protein n=1 Tax=Candidatus Spechtbacteria bacterium RIFCSPLOWO2_02_FULL_38_8 TaxID=1802164 RepID=A0A1G2HIW6_9BACT|nr:MAG: hypothetical protein A3H51_00240 [Candidatus Spechtbacteria bacterium RIFCSPLOWO2_02_FULL_38_8]